ncbi:dihydrodipicolinate synthase, partial [mine drainage metagenome]
MRPFRGIYTALVTPFGATGEIDWERFDLLLDAQAAARVDGVVVGGTTGESPSIAREEFHRLVRRAVERLPSSVDVIVGAGRSCRREAGDLIRRAIDEGASTIMLVDPSYNAPSSAEIRREYLGPLTQQHPEVRFLSYVVPGRTGTRILPEDLALAREAGPNL